MAKKFTSRDKKVHKMTRDGLVEQNLATGEEQRISQRGQDFNLQKGQQPTTHLPSKSERQSHQGHSRRQPQLPPQQELQSLESKQPQDVPLQANGIEQPYQQAEHGFNQSYQQATKVEQAVYVKQDVPVQSPKTIPSQNISIAEPALPTSHDTPLSKRIEQPTLSNKQKKMRKQQAKMFSQEATVTNHDSPKIQQHQEQQFQEHYNTNESRFVDATNNIVDNSKQSAYIFSRTTVVTQPELVSQAKQTAQTEQSTTGMVVDAPPFVETGQHERLKYTDTLTELLPSVKSRQHGTKYQKNFIADATPPTKGQQNNPKLNFAEQEKTPTQSQSSDKKLSQLQEKSDKIHTKLDNAREKLPTKKKKSKVRVFDEETGKVKHKLQIEKDVIPSGSRRSATPLPVVAVKSVLSEVKHAGINKIRNKISQVEQENVGVQAAHKGERIAEDVYRHGKKVTRSTYQFVRNTPYRTVSRLEKQATKANIKLSYQKALSENPKLKSNVLSRMMQKRKIKRSYAKAAKDAKRAGQAVKKTGNVLAKVAKAVTGFISRHPMVVGIVGLVLFCFFFLSSILSSCSNMAVGGISSIISSSYTAEDADIDTAELSYTEWETDLQMRVENAESDNPGYDEYRYNVPDIGHDPYELMAFLTSMYQDFQYANVESVLREIFAEQYQLGFVPEVEIRYRTETRTDSDGEDYDVEVPYEWHILNVNLTAQSFSEVVASRMNTEQAEMFELYMETKGNRQYLVSPFDFNWLPYVSSYYGWRVHPITGEKDYHKGIDIAVPTGTEIIAGHEGKITSAGDVGGYGLVVVIENDKGLVSKYAHCSELLVSVGQEVKKGDVIAKVGNTGNSTGPHLHLEIIKNGQYLNPIFFGETNDDGSGRVPPGSPGGVVFPEYPGALIGDGSYAALIEEAEKHLGKRYVFGANGPANFDCSSFVCWTFRNSGVYNLPRTTAQGVFNQCTPISPANAQPGDLIFFTGTYSTPNAVSHIGIYVGNGMMVHAGDPVQYTSINSSYWQNHFYSFGRLN